MIGSKKLIVKQKNNMNYHGHKNIIMDLSRHPDIICKKAWYNIHNIPQSTFYTYQHNFQQGHVKGIHGNTNKCKPRAHTVAVIETLHKNCNG